MKRLLNRRAAAVLILGAWVLGMAIWSWQSARSKNSFTGIWYGEPTKTLSIEANGAWSRKVKGKIVETGRWERSEVWHRNLDSFSFSEIPFSRHYAIETIRESPSLTEMKQRGEIVRPMEACRLISFNREDSAYLSVDGLELHTVQSGDFWKRPKPWLNWATGAFMTWIRGNPVPSRWPENFHIHPGTF